MALDDDTKDILSRIAAFIGFVGVLLIVILIPVSIRDVDYDEYAIRYDSLTKRIHSEIYAEGKYVFTPETKLFTFKRVVSKLNLDLECLSKDAIMMELDIMIQYQISKDDIWNIFTKFGEQSRWLDYIHLVSEDSCRDTCASYEAQNFYVNRSAIQSTMEQQLITAFETSDADCDVISVVLTNYEYPIELQDAIKDKQSAFQDIAKATNENEGALVDANTALLTAQINAQQIAIQAEAEVNAISAEKTAKVAAIEGLWSDRETVYSNIKSTLGMNSDQFVSGYLSSLILENAESPITDL